MRTRRSASPAAAASPGDLGGGVLASIPSLPSSSSRPSAKGSGGGTAKTKRTSSRSSSAPAAAPTAKNATDVEDEDTPTSTATGTVTGRPRSARATKASNGKAKTQDSVSESRSRRQATKSSTSTSSNANSGARKKSQEATPTDAAIASRPSLKVSAKENINDAAAVADDVHGALDDVPDATTKDTGTEKEPEQPETMSANGNSVATTSTATDDADPTSPTKVKTCTTNSKGNRGGLPPKPVNSGAVTTTAGATKSSSATASKRKAVPSKFAGGGKPPTVRNGKPPTPRNNSIAGNASAGDDDKSAAGTAAAAAATHATKRTTFLSGYNLDCTKTSSLLDLPDPPTPEGDDDDGNGSSLQDRKAKRRRRMSTGAAAFGSRRSIGTPGGGNGMGTGDDANLGNKSTSDRGDGVAVGAAAPRSIVFDDLSARARRDGGKSQRRKVRNSLCHVPSPAETSTMPSSTATGNDTGTSDNVEINGQSKQPEALQSPDKKPASTDADKAQDVDDKASPVETGGLCFDDDDDDDDDDNNATGDDSTTKKRRKKQQQRSSRSKKRQSVFLPSDFMHLSSASGRQSGVGASIEGNDANEFYSDLLSYKASATSTASADSSMSLCSNASVGSNIDANDGKVTAAEQPSTLREDPNTSNILLQAVREICSLPESKRYDSDQAGVVELLGGYPYIPPAEKERMKVRRNRNEDAKKMAAGEKGDGNDLNWTFSPSTPGPKPADDPPMSPVDPIAATLEKRRELILTLGPVVERMEAKRKEDTEAARQATGCRVSRTKKGQYKYYDLDTDEEVSPEEYKRRYFAMISGNRGGDQDQSSDSAPSPVAQGKTEEENAPVAKKTDSGHTRDLQDEGLEEESSTHEMSIDEDGDDMDISLMSMQDVEDVVSKDVLSQEASNEASNENDSLNIEPNASSTEIGGDDEEAAEEEKVASPAPGKLNPPSSSSSADFILPLPDRDDPDTDPQIAAAERRLWSDIDAALARYSRDVISIRAARKMGFTLSQTAESP